MFLYFFFFKQKTAYEMRISDWSSDVCSSDLRGWPRNRNRPGRTRRILNQHRRIVEHRRRDEAIIILRRIVTIAGIGGLRHEFQIVAEAQVHIDLEHKIGRASWRERGGQDE